MNALNGVQLQTIIQKELERQTNYLETNEFFKTSNFQLKLNIFTKLKEKKNENKEKYPVCVMKMLLKKHVAL